MKIERRNLKSPGGPDRKKGPAKQDHQNSFLEALLESQDQQEVSSIDPSKVEDQDLKNLAAIIDQYGEDLVHNPTPENFVRYKNHIRSFMAIVKKNYEVKNITSRKGFTSQKLYLTIESLDENLNDLTQLVLSKEKDRLSYLRLVDNIKGLIIDLTM